MKNILLIMLMVTGFGFGQIINIPDANFKAKLIALGVDTNTDGEIQFTEALIPTIIDVSNSNISNLTGIEAFTNLINLICISNQISVLSISNLQNLEYLNCSQNNIMNLTLNNLFSLYYVNCSFNSITNLDFSSTTIKGVNCEFNSTLKTIILKNGIISSSIENEFGIAVTSLILGNCPLLNFICCDINEIQIWENLNSNATFNSYCSFIPGGNFNTITGTIKFDTNYDGCDNLDLIAKNVKININDGNNIGNTFTNNSGNYNFYVQQSNLTVTPILENPSYFNVSPAFSTVNFPSNNNLTEIRDFCITANGFNPDAEIVLVALDQPRPGFNCRYQIVLKNKGNNSFLQEAKFNFDESKMTYVSSSEPIYGQTTGQITFNNTVTQNPFEVRMFECVMRINASTESSPVNSGDVIITSASTYDVGDVFPADNLSTLSQIAVNSFDPNDKTCLEGDFVNPSKIGQYLHYNINFENTGTADAINVVVKDVIDITKFDINSLQVIYASDNVRTDVKGNVAEFIFQNINLSQANGGPGGHGNVLFKIKTLPTLPTNTEVKNKANIYFDYNFPVITNEAKTTFAVLNNLGFVIDTSVSIYPNPTCSKININVNCNDNINCNNAIKSIEVFDIQGRILEKIIGNEDSIDLSNKNNGIYFLKINTDKGSKVEKIVKE